MIHNNYKRELLINLIYNEDCYEYGRKPMKFNNAKYKNYTIPNDLIKLKKNVDRMYRKCLFKYYMIPLRIQLKLENL